MGFGDRLNMYLKNNNMSQKELADKFGVKEQTISAYVTGTNTPSYKGLVKLCKIVKYDPNYFFQDDIDIKEELLNPEDKQILDKYHHLSSNNKSIVDYILEMEEEINDLIQDQSTVVYRLPVYEQDVAAGTGQLGFDQKHSMQEFKEHDMPSKVSYGVKIKGISMETDDEKSIPNGSTVLVTTELDYDELIGKAVIVNIKGVLVCKEYNIEEDGHLWLKSRNSNKSDEDKHIYDLDGVKIIGKVVKVIVHK